MNFKPEWLKAPEYVVEEIQRCRGAVEPGMYETGLIVDANNTMYRLAFAASKDVGDGAGMLAVFVDRVKKVAQEVGADLVVCCMDYGASLRRSLLGASKKPDKTPEEEAVVALGREALGILRGTHPCGSFAPEDWLNPRWLSGYEADDLCAAFAFSGLCVHTVLYSTDSDLYQATDGSGVTQMSPASGKFLKSEVMPSQVAAVKALTGDSSDNVWGLKDTPLSIDGKEQIGGVGPVTALAILTGVKALDLDPSDALRVRNNLTLTALPFPGAHRILGGALNRAPDFTRGEQADEEDLGPLPF